MKSLISGTICRAALIVFVPVWVLTALPSWAAPAGRGEQGTAAGRLVVEEYSASLEHVYVVDQPNSLSRERTDRAVLITEKPLRQALLRGVEDLQDVTAEIRDGAWVFFKLDDGERPIYEMVYHPSLGKNRLIMSGLTHAEFFKEVYRKDRLEGSFRTKKAESFVGHYYRLDVSVKAPVMRAARPEPLPDSKTGSPLPPGGGEPADYYRALHEAIAKRDVVMFRAMAPAEVKVRELSDREILEGLNIMALTPPDDAVVTHGFMSAGGGRAVLYLAGTADGERYYGTVEMVKAGGLWRVKKEHWGNTPPKQ